MDEYRTVHVGTGGYPIDDTVDLAPIALKHLIRCRGNSLPAIFDVRSLEIILLNLISRLFLP